MVLADVVIKKRRKVANSSRQMKGKKYAETFILMLSFYPADTLLTTIHHQQTNLRLRGLCFYNFEAKVCMAGGFAAR